jgi:hypothetical protein
MANAKEVTLGDLTWKKVTNINKLKDICDRLVKEGLGEEEVFMYSDEEGNQVNKVLCLELHTEGVTFIPHENWEK